MTYRTRRFRAAIAFTVLGVLGWVGGCSDDSTSPCSDCPPPQGLIVSDPASTASITAGMGTLAARSSSAGDEVAYVSLPPGTAPTGRTTTIHRVGGTEPFNTTLFEGGLDPVPVVAQAGDSIDVVVRDAAGGTVLQARLAVAVRRPPVVVRSEPPRKKTDVPLNAAIMVVFSEPMAGGTLTSSSVQLFRGPSPVAGSVRLLEGTATAAVFVPAAPLDPNTQYRLEVTRAVQDLDGDALPANTTMEFTTGQSLTGPAASIALSPLNIDVGYGLSVFMTGPTYQLTATVRDAAGNQLIDEPVTWSTRDPYSPSNPPGVSVSATGLLTALGPTGFWIVAAAVDGLSAEAPVVVSAGPAASVEVTPSSATVGAAGDTIHLTATVRDALGRLLDTPLVLWLSSAQPLATVTADTSGSAGLSFATVTGVSPGSVTITARRETASGTASVTIIPPLPVASVTVTPATATLLTQVTTQLSATVRDANNKVLAGRPISWTTDNAAVATVNANGLVTGVSEGSAAVTATSEGVSDTAAITVTVPAAAPSGTNAVPLNSRINITWVDNATNETGFRLQRSLDSGAYWATALTIGSPNVTATTDWWPPGEVTVCYRVIAFNAQSDSPPSNVDCTALPEEPTDLAGTAMDAQTVALSWSDNSSVEDGYEVLRSADGGWAYAAVATVPPNSTAFQDGGLTGNLTYSYKVRAIKDSGGSYPSNVIAVPVDPRTPPTAPGLGQPAGFFLGFILLEWSDGPNNQEGYKIEMCYGTTCADADFWVVGTVGATDRSYYVVAPGWGVFSFRVRATNRLGDSPPSNVAYGRTCVEEDYNAPCFP